MLGFNEAGWNETGIDDGAKRPNDKVAKRDDNSITEPLYWSLALSYDFE